MSASAPLLVSLIAASASRTPGAAAPEAAAPVRGVQHVQRRRGLDGDGGHAVRHRVVQFPCDPEAFLGHPPRSLALALLVGQAQPLRGLGGQCPAVAHGVAEQDGQQQQDQRGQEFLRQGQRAGVLGRADQEQPDGHVEGRDDDGQGQEPGRRRVVERQAEQRHGGDVAPVGGVEHQQQHRAGDQHPARPAPADQDRQAHRRAPAPGQRVERLLARTAGRRDVQLHGGDDRGRGQHVDGPDAQVGEPARRTAPSRRPRADRGREPGAQAARRAAESAHVATVRDPQGSGNGRI